MSDSQAFLRHCQSEPETLAELKPGDAFILFPFDGDDDGHGGFRVGSRVYVKIEPYYPGGIYPASCLKTCREYTRPEVLDNWALTTYVLKIYGLTAANKETEPQAAAPPSPVTIPPEQIEAFTSMQERLRQLESAQRSREQTYQQDQAIVADKVEAALRTLREQSERYVQAERARIDQTEERARRYALASELSRALSAYRLVPGGAEQLTRLWRDRFLSNARGDAFAVPTSAIQSVADFVAQQLARPEFARFLRPPLDESVTGQAEPDKADVAVDAPKHQDQADCERLRQRALEAERSKQYAQSIARCKVLANSLEEGFSAERARSWAAYRSTYAAPPESAIPLLRRWFNDGQVDDRRMTFSASTLEVWPGDLTELSSRSLIVGIATL